MTKEEFIKLGVKMGYADKKQAESFCRGYLDDHVFSDDDFIPLYRNGYGKEGRNEGKLRSQTVGDNVIRTTKRFRGPKSR